MMRFGDNNGYSAYIYRPGAYAFIYESGLVAVVRNSLGYFLLGGGNEAGEDDEACLKREFIEETGFSVKVGEFLEEVEEYVHVPEWDKTYHKVMRFYRAGLGSHIGGKIEDDHELMWLSPDKAAGVMYLKGQAYIIEKYAK
jgi:8-oxo-dGTP diphosphatase